MSLPELNNLKMTIAALLEWPSPPPRLFIGGGGGGGVCLYEPIKLSQLSAQLVCCWLSKNKQTNKQSQ